LPFYSYHCKRCDAAHDAYKHISERHDGPMCCEEQAQLCILPPAVQPDLPGYESPVTGKWVEGRKSRREDLRASGCRPYEDPADERKEAARQRAYNEQRQDKALQETLMKTFYAMPEAKRRILTRG
jgi:hypothetical protein